MEGSGPERTGHGHDGEEPTPARKEETEIQELK